MSFVLILYFDWLLGPHKEQNFEKKKKKKKHSKIFSSETVKWMNPVLCIHVPDSSLYIISVYTPGIYADGYIVFAFPFVRSSVRMFVSSFVRSFVCSFVSSVEFASKFWLKFL